MRFEPTGAVSLANLQFLYERSLANERVLLLQDSYAAVELSWWYVGDRSQQLSQQMVVEVQETDEILLGLVASEDDRVRLLLHAVVDVWDGLAQQRWRIAIGRRFVERFLDWERSVPMAVNGQTLVLLKILCWIVIEMLERSTDR